MFFIFLTFQWLLLGKKNKFDSDDSTVRNIAKIGKDSRLKSNNLYLLLADRTKNAIYGNVYYARVTRALYQPITLVLNFELL